MNRPIRFWGLSPLQFSVIALFGAITIIVLVFKRVHPIALIGVISFLGILFSLLFKKLKEEHKKGNPNYLQGYFIKGSTPKKIIDKNRAFKHLIKTWK